MPHYDQEADSHPHSPSHGRQWLASWDSGHMSHTLGDGGHHNLKPCVSGRHLEAEPITPSLYPATSVLSCDRETNLYLM